MKCENLYALTFTQLAGRLGEDRNSIARALAEPDAPQKRKRGWVISEIESFMFLRRLRKMTDADFVALCQQVEHGSFDAAYFCDADNARRMLGEIRIKGRIAMMAELRGEL